MPSYVSQAGYVKIPDYLGSQQHRYFNDDVGLLIRTGGAAYLIGGSQPFNYTKIDDKNVDWLYGKTADGFLYNKLNFISVGQRDRSIKGNDGYKWKKERRFTTGAFPYYYAERR